MKQVLTPESRVAQWVEMLAERDIPVLRRSVVLLTQFKRREDSVNPRELSKVILRDPLLTLLVVRYLQTRSSQRRLAEITTVEHAVMMLGVSPFFAAFSGLKAIEDVLGNRQQALPGLMQVVSRARAAALYAGSWAALRADIESDEIMVAALLHDMAEILLWCFSPDEAAAIDERLRREPGLRSSSAQCEVLGFELSQLQLALAERWQLPQLLLSLMNDEHAEMPRVQNVALGVALARHVSQGWNNPALPDDLARVSSLLCMPEDDVLADVFDTTLRAVAEREWYGPALGGSFLPQLPGGVPEETPPTEAESRAAVLDHALSWLDGLALGVPRKGQRRHGMLRNVTYDTLSAIAALLDGATRGLGFRYGVLLVIDASSGRYSAKYFSAEFDMARWSSLGSAPGVAQALRSAVDSRVAATHVGTVATGEGLYAMPVVLDEQVSALAVAWAPRAAEAMTEEAFAGFCGLGERFTKALTALGGMPFWAQPRA